MTGPSPVVPQILAGHEDRGENARIQCFVGCIAVGDMLKSTLGPQGMDKILQRIQGAGGPRSHRTEVTNDGATILSSMYLDNPAAKLLVDVSMKQDQSVGDGTTGVIVLAAEFLRQAERLIEKKIHPQVIIEGYRMALEVAQAKLQEVSLALTQGSVDPAERERFREVLEKIAQTTLSSKLLLHDKEHFAKLAVDAVLRLKDRSNLDLIQIIKKKGGSLKESVLEDGFILEKRVGNSQPKTVTDCKILIANTPMDTDKIKIYAAKVTVSDFDSVAEIEEAEKEKMRNKVDKIAAFGCNVFINRQLIYNYPEQLFADKKIAAIEHSDFEGMERLAAALGGEIISTFDSPSEAALGRCDKMEEIMIGEDKAIRFSGCAKREACTVILRGGSEHILDEAERSLHDAVAIVSQTCVEPAIVFGGGAAELAAATAVDALARSVQDKRSLAIQAFAEALRVIPNTLLDNAGLDSAEIMAKLNALHAAGKFEQGVDIADQDAGDMRSRGIFEAYKSKKSQFYSAAEAAEQIIRVDNVIRCAPRQRTGQ